MPSNAQPSLTLVEAVATTGVFPAQGSGGGYVYLGTIHVFAGNFTPGGEDGGSHFADGSLLPITGNEALFQLYGTMYGGNGITNFALPNMNGGLSIGQQGNQGQLTGSALLPITQASLPPSSGGTSAPVDNNQASEPVRYAISYIGSFPSASGGAEPSSIGMVTQIGGSYVPGGTIECDGRLLSIADYPSLFQVIGTMYGGDGETTFAVPDMRGRSVIGAGGDFHVGDVVGSGTATIALENMPVEMGGAGVPLDNQGPGLVMTQLLATEGVFPSRDGGYPEDFPVIGEILTFAGNFVPAGFTAADGHHMNISTNTALFSILGTTYGGNGVNDFAVPNLTGRSVSGTNLAAGSDALGTESGSTTVTLTLDDFPALDFAGTAAGESLYGANHADTILGLAGDDMIVGNGGNDHLDGGTGVDTLAGGLGDDRYVVDDAADHVVELYGQGIDTVDSSVTYSLAAQDNVENLRLTGTAAINGTGNALNNTLTGNGAANILNGGEGADVMRGGAGDDVYYVDNIGDQAVELDGKGSDTVNSTVTFSLAGQYTEVLNLLGAAAINGTGNSLNNRIVGNGAANVLVGGDGNDRLDGGAGADKLVGGLGNDTFVIDNAGDKIVENDGEGTDTVEASISYSLAGQYVEILKLTGTGDINGTGNSLDNTLTGNASNNILNGAAGADAMAGGLGNDTYYVDNVYDKVTEGANAGTDTVLSSVTFSIAGQYVEVLTLTGTAAINATGNSQANTITGNAAINALNGGAGDDDLHGMLGSDTLTGGAGADHFWFETTLGAGNVDTIGDFSHADDTITLDRTIFAGIAANGALNAAAFFQGAAAHDADDRIVYDKATGDLWYDADGNGAGAAVKFAHVTPNTALDATDFFAVA